MTDSSIVSYLFQSVNKLNKYKRKKKKKKVSRQKRREFSLKKQQTTQANGNKASDKENEKIAEIE